MLRIQFKELSNSVTMRIEGRLVGKYAEDARRAFIESKLLSDLVVDLSGMTFVDDTGEEVLCWLKRIGSKFIAETAYSQDVCERLHLPSGAKRNGNCAQQCDSVGRHSGFERQNARGR